MSILGLRVVKNSFIIHVARRRVGMTARGERIVGVGRRGRRILCGVFTKPGFDIFGDGIDDLAQFLVARVLCVGEATANVAFDERHGEGILRTWAVWLDGRIVGELKVEHW